MTALRNCLEARSEAAPNMTVSARLLVVDDEPGLLNALRTSLRFAGYEVRTASTGEQAVAVAERVRPDLLVLDVELPGLSGFDVVRRLRNRGIDAPTVFLTSSFETQDVGGLTIGGDDYLLKPFSLDELAARVRAALRRARIGLRGRFDDGVLRFADLELDENINDVRRAGRRVPLSPMERKVLRYLLLNAGLVMTRRQIIDHVWPYDFSGGTRVLDVHVCNLRRKLDRFGPALIHTAYGTGYSLCLPSACDSPQSQPAPTAG